MERWIPVTERLPEDSGCVLTYRPETSGDKIIVERFIRFTNGGKLWMGDAPYRGPVTHWMPLPDEPEVEA